jgi:hypothetical protein
MTMIARKSFAKLLVVLALGMLLIAAALPAASVEAGPAQVLPTRTRSGSGGLAATGAAAATKAAGLVSTAAAAATKASAAQTQIAGTAAALATRAGSVKATLTLPATVPAAQAATAIAEYAESVLGIAVTVKKASGVTGEVTRSLAQTAAGSKAQASAVRLAGVSYGAILSNGAASLSYGSGQVTGDVTVDVQGGALGVYSLATTYTGSLNAESALALAKNTFPGVANFSYTKYSVTTGYAWSASGSVTGYDAKTKKFVSLAQAVILYVVPGASGKASVTATVGRGEFATAVKP